MFCADFAIQSFVFCACFTIYSFLCFVLTLRYIVFVLFCADFAIYSIFCFVLILRYSLYFATYSFVFCAGLAI